MQPRRLIPIVSGLALAVVGVRMTHAGGKADHLICYRMADSAQIAAAVDMIADLQPEFSQRNCRLLKPIEFCVPATKQNIITSSPTPPDLVGQPLRQDYICYLARCPALSVPPAKQVADQFAVHVEQKYKATKICVPAAKLPIRCGDAEAPRCGGVCPAGATCKLSAATGQCACQPLPCGGQPDKGGTCGGACPDGQICQLSNSTSGKPTCGCGQVPPPPCGNNPLTGSCGGACTDPTQICQVDASGNCGCGPIPQPCGNTSGVCGGTCPNPADQCVPGTVPGQPCTCVPPPCHQDPVTGACSGTCATGAAPGTCHLSANGCVCGPPPCSIDPASGQCAGPCPNGGTCAPDSANNCTCLQPCNFNVDNVCGGACPPGETCQVTQTGTQRQCLCVKPPNCTFGAETPNFCSGFCPPGQLCRTIKTPSAGLQCLCLNN
jgi:hypothetical protein